MIRAFLNHRYNDPRTWVVFGWIVFMVTVCGIASAGEAAPAPAPAESKSDSPDILKLIMEALLPAVIGIVTYVLHRKGKYKGMIQEVIEALDTGRHVAQTEYAGAIKKSREDGKLTDEEKAEARRIAVKAAYEELKGPALELLKSWGKPKVEKLLKGLVEKAKDAIGRKRRKRRKGPVVEGPVSNDTED